MFSVIAPVTEFVSLLAELVQFAGDKLEVSCKTKSVVGDHEIVT